MRNSRTPVVAGAAAAGVLALLFLPMALSEFRLHLAIMTGIFMVLSLSLNLISGNTGIVSLGHAGFFAIGAYTSAILAKSGTPFLAALLAGALLSGLFSLLLAIPALRVTGIYLKVITIAAGLIVHLLVTNLEITGGVSGIMGIPRPSVFGLHFRSTLQYYYLVVFWLLLSIGLVVLIEHSYIGRALKSLRDDELAATTLGVNPITFKVLAFFLSATLAGIAGSLYAHYARFIGPDSFTISLSIRILMMIVIGGLGSVWGSVLGTLMIYLLPEVLRFLDTSYYLVFGLLLTLMALFLPGGLIQIPRRILALVRQRRPQGSEGM